MQLDDLLRGLQAENPTTRLQAAQMIGTLDETRALDALAAQYCAERAHEVKMAISWAAQRLQAAVSAGQETLPALFQYFHIDNELEAKQDEAERQLLNQMQHNTDMDIIRSQNKKGRDAAVGIALGGALMGMQGIAIGAMMAMQPGVDALSSGLEARPQIGKTRVPPTRPSDTDIRMMVRRLLELPDAEKRRRGALDLAAANNPAALPYLAQAFVEDTDTAVREAAQRAAKQIYWNSLYWEMERSGEIAAEIERRAAQAAPSAPQPPAAASAPSAPVQPPAASGPAEPGVSNPLIRRIQPAAPAAPPAAPSDTPPAPKAVNLADVLRKADEAREKRRKM
jgi:hypothetical protein